jgi:SnoaL-like domain
MRAKLSVDDLEAVVAEVQLIRDKAEIRETLDRYWFGEDRCEADIVISTFIEVARYGGIRGHEDIRSVMQALRAYDSLHHCFASSKIEVDGDTATADTMAVGFALATNDAGEQRCLVRGMRYIDRLVRTESGWLIAERCGHDSPDHGHDTFWQFEGMPTEVWHPRQRA